LHGPATRRAGYRVRSTVYVSDDATPCPAVEGVLSV
jgi:hypothetical protein